MRTVVAATLIAVFLGCSATVPGGDVSHEAPELEALLPNTVSGEALEPASMVGHTLIESIVGDLAGADADAYERGYLDAGLDLEDLRMAVASPNGGFDVVRVALWPSDEVGAYAYDLMVSAAGIKDDLGTPDMTVRQLESMPGRRPYLYTAGDNVFVIVRDNDDHVFLIVTDDEKWAEAVLQQLP